MSRSSNGIYFDTSSKADVVGIGRNKRHASYRAEVRIDGQRIRKRFKKYDEAKLWISQMLERPIGYEYAKASGAKLGRKKKDLPEGFDHYGRMVRDNGFFINVIARLAKMNYWTFRMYYKKWLKVVR